MYRSQGFTPKKRRLQIESLEQRRLLAAGLGHNFVEPEDVNLDGYVSSLDALNIINQLSREPNSSDGNPEAIRSTSFLLDVDQSGHLSALDALRVINQLPRGEREPESLSEGVRKLAAAIVTEEFPSGLPRQTVVRWLANLEQRTEVSEDRRGAFHRLDSNADGEIEPSEVSTEIWEQISSADANSNAAVTSDELMSNRPAEEEIQRPENEGAFIHLDGNEDGALTDHEVSQRAWERISLADEDSDGAVTLAELTASRDASELRIRMPNPENAFDELDLNEDGRLTLDEIRETVWTTLARADANNDVEIELTELLSARDEDERLIRLPNPESAFTRLDINANGVLSADELHAEVWQKLSASDRNANGDVTLEELSSTRSENERDVRKPNPHAAFAALDVEEDGDLVPTELTDLAWSHLLIVDLNLDGAVTLEELSFTRTENERDVRKPNPNAAFAALDVDGDGRLTADEIGETVWTTLARADANNDLEIELTELSSAREEDERLVQLPNPESAFTRLDTNANGVLSADELHAEVWQELSVSDRNANGEVTLDELSFSRSENERDVRKPNPNAAFAALDVEEDGDLTPTELTNHTWSQLVIADLNFDGAVTLAELTASRDARELRVRMPNPENAFDELDLNEDGRLTADEIRETVWTTLARADANNDLEIELTELLSAREEEERLIRLPNPESAFTRLDTNANGVLSADELNAEAWQKLSASDRNANGEVTLDELSFTRSENERDVRKPNPSTAFAALDVDGDGNLAPAELTNLAWSQLLIADSNLDGAVTLSELIANREAIENDVLDPTNIRFLSAFAQLDLNGDGGLSVDEVHVGTWTQLATADTNLDGLVTAHEIENEPEDIADLVRTVFDGTNLPALTGAIIDSEGMRAIGTTGVRVAGGNDPVVKSELWHLGSNTKAMTATLYATFVRDGELSFDNTMEELFPNLNVHSGFANVTPRMLLAHRGGAPAAIFPQQWSDWWAGGDVQTLRAEWAEVLLQNTPPATVGQYTYSNGGYVIVGAILEAHTGKSWEQLMQERLFTPLEMDRCGFGAPPAGSAVGHDSTGTPQHGLDNPPTLGPAGTVHCDLQSWSKFVSANIAGPNGESAFLPATLWNELHDPQDGYALGWGVSNQSWTDGVVLSHSGSNTSLVCGRLGCPRD